MALPTTPTATSIATEALSRLNEPNPSAGMLTRAESILLGIVNQIAKRGEWRVLEETKSIVVTSYQPRYAIPADFSKGVDLRLYSGGRSGTMQSATASTIVLAAAETLTVAAAQGAPIFMLSGNATGYWSRIVSYNDTSKEAGISPNWGITPTSGTYLVPDEEIELPHQFLLKPRLVDTIAKPKMATIYDDEIYLSPVPSTGPYALLSRFQVKPYQLDLADTRYNKIYWDWREALILGIIRDYAYTPNDDRYIQADKDFEKAVAELKLEEKRRATWG